MHDPEPDAGSRAGITDLPRYLTDESEWVDASVVDTGRPIIDVPFVTIGGGLGSLAMVHVLRIAGLQPAEIRILSASDLPHERFTRWAGASQIAPGDPLRSGSEGTMDSIWGWPGYAVRLAVENRSFRPLWTVFTEPVFSEYFTPSLGQLSSSVSRETRRLDWSSMLSKGIVVMVRRRVGGGYFVVQRCPRTGKPDTLLFYRCRYVHLAVGHLAPRVLPDIQAYRQRFGDDTQVVQAYEPHEQLYQRLRDDGGTIILRGAGVVASRVLQRLCEDRANTNASIRILHVMRTDGVRPTGSRFTQRAAEAGFSYQAFNFPKAAFGGQIKMKVARSEEPERVQIIRALGGTSTPRRRQWRKQIEAGVRGGWYRQYVGESMQLKRTPAGRLTLLIRQGNSSTTELQADCLIDATGLEDDLRGDQLLRDVLVHAGARTNTLGYLAVEPTFEITGTRSHPGRAYASGALTLGASYAPVDSFLGLHYAALSIADDLARQGFCRRIGAWRSSRQWWRWLRNRAP